MSHMKQLIELKDALCNLNVNDFIDYVFSYHIDYDINNNSFHSMCVKIHSKCRKLQSKCDDLEKEFRVLLSENSKPNNLYETKCLIEKFKKEMMQFQEKAKIKKTQREKFIKDNMHSILTFDSDFIINNLNFTKDKKFNRDDVLYLTGVKYCIDTITQMDYNQNKVEIDELVKLTKENIKGIVSYSKIQRPADEKEALKHEFFVELTRAVNYHNYYYYWCSNQLIQEVIYMSGKCANDHKDYQVKATTLNQELTELIKLSEQDNGNKPKGYGPDRAKILRFKQDLFEAIQDGMYNRNDREECIDLIKLYWDFNSAPVKEFQFTFENADDEIDQLLKSIKCALKYQKCKGYDTDSTTSSISSFMSSTGYESAAFNDAEDNIPNMPNLFI